MPYYMNKPDKPRAKPTGKDGGQRSSANLRRRLDKVFSRYIRLRDAMPSGFFRCIACGQIKPISQADCGHYHSRTHTATRWDEDNCHAECRYCNRFRADHLIGYRENLVRKIGQQRFDMLAVRAGTTCQLSAFVLEMLIKYYTEKVGALRREKGIRI